MYGFAINPGWRILLRDVGVDAGNLLRRAGLPGDLFSRERVVLDTDTYFGLWRALEAETDDPTLPIRIGQAVTVEAFDPPVFAAVCSENLRAALPRIARYKQLVCPLVLGIEDGAGPLVMTFTWSDASRPPPAALVLTELVYFVQLARLATRERVVPLEVRAPEPPAVQAAFQEFLGVTVTRGEPAVVFSAEDAARPFLTANEAMWGFFEPELARRLAELEAQSSTAERVKAALLELLPTGGASVDAVAARLGTSKRTLQRRLGAEGTSFQQVLDGTREQLARHYLRRSSMSGAEISFLLGFEDPNSFFRAFHAWTGTTPEQARLQ
ncbi:MAG: AraC family transcriptional regulator [Myxococcales bacterium]|nr:AraC family transcriptional regulator [Myxococcales bacterium]MCB9652323.1 AraC family transcriptional regulator [Deltaproteobacteria bacterium]